MNHNPENIIEIRDPEIASSAIFETIRTNMAKRNAANLPSLSHFKRVEMDTLSTTTPNLNSLMLQLMGTPPLREVQFTSTVPLIGSLLVAIRKAWNWMSTKWYVQPIITQQGAINAQLVTLLNEMVEWQEIQTDTISQLHAKVERLEDQLAHVEEQ